MSKVEELRRTINEGNSKLNKHQQEVDYWLKELRRLNEELARETKREQEETRRVSQKKTA